MHRSNVGCQLSLDIVRTTASQGSQTALFASTEDLPQPSFSGFFNQLCSLVLLVQFLLHVPQSARGHETSVLVTLLQEDVRYTGPLESMSCLTPTNIDLNYVFKPQLRSAFTTGLPGATRPHFPINLQISKWGGQGQLDSRITEHTWSQLSQSEVASTGDFN